MSLKALHVVFIVASIVLALGFGGWSLNEFAQKGARSDLWFGIGSLAAGLLLIIYGKAMLRKLKDISYL
ncbi:MAG TPA: hypothetical protein VK846_19550 [Candidatus Limnocylindria bacterium]|nr:hypothetical protein [Candidatus Limnocylindria bacterium]